VSRADELRELHRAPPILVLPNAWDVASAKAFAALDGVRAIATTSAGCARSLGWEDGEQIPRDEMLAAVERIVRAVDVPVTADLEAGYGDPAATARLAVELGAAGMNLEDQNRPLADAAARVRVAREAAPLVLNARIDVFLPGGSDDIDDAVERANAYLEAGADCVYPIMLAERERIGDFVQRVNGPVNVMAQPTAPPIDELERLGVARVTFGSGLHRVALAAAVEKIGR
jgi:2-methylisocitrate lyase-like PEP mutase family enzyme